MAILPMGPASQHRDSAQDSMQDSMFDLRPPQLRRQEDDPEPRLQAYSQTREELRDEVHAVHEPTVYEPVTDEPVYDQTDATFADPDFDHDAPSPMLAATVAATVAVAVTAPEPAHAVRDTNAPWAESAQEPAHETEFEPAHEPAHATAAAAEPQTAALTLISVDDFAALEDRILRAVSLVRTERQSRLDAEARTAALEAQILALDAQASTIETLQKEIDSLRTEREQVRNRVERLLGQLDALEL